MKKLIFTIAFALVAAMSISSCTEQVIKPRDGGSLDCGQPGATPCPPK